MDKRVQGLVALAAVVVIAVGGHLGYAEWQRGQEHLQFERNLRWVKLSEKVADTEKQLSRWDSGDRQWAYDKWGNKAPEIIDFARFMLPGYRDDLANISNWRP